VTGLLAGGVEGGQWGCGAAGSGYPVQPRAGCAEDDDALRGPGAGGEPGDVAEGLGRSAGDLDLFQLALGAKSEETAVGGPEEVKGLVGAGQGLGFEGSEGPDSDRGSAALRCGHEGHAAAVGGDGWHEAEAGFLRGGDLETNNGGVGGRGFPEVDQRDRGRENGNSTTKQRTGPSGPVTGVSTFSGSCSTDHLRRIRLKIEVGE